MLNNANVLFGIVTGFNNKIDGQNPNRIHVGMVMKISIYEPYLQEIMQKMNCN